MLLAPASYLYRVSRREEGHPRERGAYAVYMVLQTLASAASSRHQDGTHTGTGYRRREGILASGLMNKIRERAMDA